ncbi:Gfo/Idh/MocA family protein [Ornithinibacillus caprae]|nr:Gfo/Idh/MocA family oxidoreductase [Ornithinibacillus caprae]
MKFSTIGTSWITEMFIQAAKLSGKAKLLSVYSRNEETAKSFAEKNNAEKWYNLLDEMLQDDTDFVYIASPNILHYEHVMKCIQSEKHVFCEKPMAFTQMQVKKIREEAIKYGVYVFEGYRHLFSPNYEILKNTIEQIGEIRSVFLQYIQYSSRYDAYKEGKQPNIFSKEFAGGALMDLGVYPLSAAIDLFGDPEDIHYFPVLLTNGIDGSGTLVLKYKGFNVTIMCSKVAQGTIPSEIQGEDGTITIDHIAPIHDITIYNRLTKEKKQLAQSQLELDMVYEIEVFTRLIAENDSNSFHKWMDRSESVAKWTEKVRHDNNILFLGE